VAVHRAVLGDTATTSRSSARYLYGYCATAPADVRHRQYHDVDVLTVRVDDRP